MKPKIGGVEVDELCIRYCIKNNGGVKKSLELPYATLTFDERGVVEFIRGPMGQVYNVSDMKIFSFLYERARQI